MRQRTCVYILFDGKSKPEIGFSRNLEALRPREGKLVFAEWFDLTHDAGRRHDELTKLSRKRLRQIVAQTNPKYEDLRQIDDFVMAGAPVSDPAPDANAKWQEIRSNIRKIVELLASHGLPTDAKSVRFLIDKGYLPGDSDEGGVAALMAPPDDSPRTGRRSASANRIPPDDADEFRGYPKEL
jgi:hypothetical protein